MADNADRAADQMEVLDQTLLDRRPRLAQRLRPGTDCMACGEEIPAERRAAVSGCCLCFDCQADAERRMGR